MSQRDFDIDTASLIQLVEVNPALWDRSLGIHKDKLRVKELWWQVSAQIDDQFEQRTEAEQKQFVVEVKKKWINVRDSWIKSFKVSRTGAKKRKYIYFNQLRFLAKVVNFNQSIASGDENCSIDTEEDHEDIKNVPQQLCRPMVREIKPEAALQPGPNRQEEPAGSRKAEDTELRLSVAVHAEPKVEDPRLLFFKGILPSIQHFSTDEFIDFQIGVLQLIKNINSQATLGQQRTTGQP